MNIDKARFFWGAFLSAALAALAIPYFANLLPTGLGPALALLFTQLAMQSLPPVTKPGSAVDVAVRASKRPPPLPPVTLLCLVLLGCAPAVHAEALEGYSAEQVACVKAASVLDASVEEKLDRSHACRQAGKVRWGLADGGVQ